MSKTRVKRGRGDARGMRSTFLERKVEPKNFLDIRF